MVGFDSRLIIGPNVASGPHALSRIVGFVASWPVLNRFRDAIARVAQSPRMPRQRADLPARRHAQHHAEQLAAARLLSSASAIVLSAAWQRIRPR